MSALSTWTKMMTVPRPGNLSDGVMAKIPIDSIVAKLPGDDVET